MQPTKTEMYSDESDLACCLTSEEMLKSMQQEELRMTDNYDHTNTMNKVEGIINREN